MIVLGISPFGQNPAAAIIVDGTLIAFAEEERFVRIKSAFGKFPGKALSYCLREANLTLTDVDCIAVGWESNKYRYTMPLVAASLWLRYGIGRGSGAYDSALHELVAWRPENALRHIQYGLYNTGYKGKIPKIEFVPHHLAHAASTFYASGFDTATILILDGSGEERATTLYKGNGLEITEITSVDIPHSLGWFYAATTAYLGFKPYEDDGFIMGLAPYGRPSDEMREKARTILRLEERGEYSVHPQFTLLGDHTWNEHFSDQYIRLFGTPRLQGSPMTQRHKNIAFAIQERLEETIVTLGKRAVRESGYNDVCLAGGVALNCKANGVLAQTDFVNNMFIQPASHDAGAALGAAMIIARDAGDDPRFHMSHSRWGPSFNEDSVRHILDEAMVPYTRKKNMADTIADSIALGKIVARFHGRMEAGPRALGGRSILANPAIQGMNDVINKRVKHRDPWRPFCPSMIETISKEYLVGPKETRFMTVIYDVPKGKKKDISAVTHIDGTTRPQTVSKAEDEEYYNIIRAVGEKTDVPVVLNTSLNVKGEPIACSPVDALKCFYSTGIDAMALGSFWLEKK